MGSFSIWHWVIVILVVAPLAVVALVKPNSVASAEQFRLDGIADLIFLAAGLLAFFVPALVLAQLLNLVFKFFWLAAAANRLQAVGRNKWWTLVGIYGLSFAVSIYLLATGGDRVSPKAVPAL